MLFFLINVANNPNQKSWERRDRWDHLSHWLDDQESSEAADETNLRLFSLMKHFLFSSQKEVTGLFYSLLILFPLSFCRRDKKNNNKRRVSFNGGL